MMYRQNAKATFLCGQWNEADRMPAHVIRPAIVHLAGIDTEGAIALAGLPQKVEQRGGRLRHEDLAGCDYLHHRHLLVSVPQPDGARIPSDQRGGFPQCQLHNGILISLRVQHPGKPTQACQTLIKQVLVGRMDGNMRDTVLEELGHLCEFAGIYRGACQMGGHYFD